MHNNAKNNQKKNQWMTPVLEEIAIADTAAKAASNKENPAKKNGS